MAQQISVSSSVSVPVILGWTCSKCGKKNAVQTTLTIKHTNTREGFLSKEFKEQNIAELEEMWRSEALRIILCPDRYIRDFPKYVDIRHCKCSNCKKRENWAKTTYIEGGLAGIFVELFSLVFILSGCGAFLGNSKPALVVMIISLILLIPSIILSKKIESKTEKYPIDSLPLMATLNDELVQFAREQKNMDILADGFLRDTLYVLNGIEPEWSPVQEPIIETSPLNKGNTNKATIDLKEKNLQPKLRRAFILIEDSEWDKADAYLDSILEEEPENAYAYLGKIMINLNINELSDISNNIDKIKQAKEFKHITKYADTDLLKFLDQY